MSHLAGKGLLQRFNLGANEDGEPLDEAAFVDRMTEGECVACVGELGHDIFRTIEPHVVSAVLNRRGPREGVLRLLAKQNALVARFHSVDDKETDRARNEEENGDE